MTGDKKEDDRSLVVIHEASNSMTAGLLKSLLEAEGVPAVILGDLGAVWDSIATFRPRVAVPADVVDQAKGIIRDCIEKAEDIAAEGWPEDEE